MAHEPMRRRQQRQARPLLMAHYMPWYEADPGRDRWGWHWTMNHFKPGRIDGRSARREAASRFYPRIGLYDSNDPDVLECHVLLMKMAGIGGVIIDWYGIDDYLDYGLLHRNSQHLIRFAQRAGLRFAVMYEEQTVPKLLEAGRIPDGDVLAHGKRVLGWLRGHWFEHPAYLRWEGRPVFLTFGSGYYTGEQWRAIFAELSPPISYLVTQSAPRGDAAVGAFCWPEPAKGTDAALAELDRFYRRAKDWPRFVAGAFPRFEDVYEAAGVHPSWGRIEDRGGAVYRETLENALKSGAPVTQLVTWNDWGEGTMIEPSVEFGYRDLEATQELYLRHVDPRMPYAPADLRLPVALYLLRKKRGGDTGRPAVLGEVSRRLFAGRAREARALLAEKYPDALAYASR